jgi:FixJ family two-component response regulator
VITAGIETMLDQGPGRQSPERGPQFPFMPETSRWIAIVDDDPSVLKALRRSLRVRALQSKIYSSAQEFLASLADGLPKCLIVDLQMPEMTGLELHQHLIRSGIKIPTIIITAHSDVRVRERSESAGVIAVLSKPLQKTLLIAAIEDASNAATRGDLEGPEK